MDIGNNELAKSLVDLIDETLDEIEELKKSSKFAASEVKIEGPGKDGVDGHPTDGKLDAKKAEDKDVKDEDDDKDKDMEKSDVEKACSDVAKMDDVEKAEMYKMYMENKMKKGVNEQADPGAVHKGDDVAKGVNEQADPGAVHKSAEPVSEPVQKTEEDGDLLKSYIDGRISSLEGKFAEVSELVKKIGEQPVERKSVAAGAQVDPLKKSADEVEPLSKSEIASKMFELKKSGTFVDSVDIAQVEMGSEHEAREIAAKYDIK